MPPHKALFWCCLTALAVFCADAPPLAAQPQSFAPIVKAQRDKVVHINTSAGKGLGGGARSGQPFRFPDPNRGTGSGFIISTDGYIVTNYHVVKSANEIEVVLADEQTYPAQIVGLDAQTDLALLKIRAHGLPAARFGDSDSLEVGDWVIAIGNPLGLDYTVTAGIISAKGRNIFGNENLAYGEFLQTDAAINPGNSGGPLFNLTGEVIGVNSAISRRGQGIGFAVPSNLVVEVVRQLREHGRVDRGWLGVVIQELTAKLVTALALPAQTRGVVVDELLADSPARETGLRKGDVLTTFRRKPLRRVAQLQKLVALTQPGSRVAVEGLRRDSESSPWQPLKLNLSIGRNPASARAGEISVLARLGISAVNIPDTLRRSARLGEDVGVLVESVAPGATGETLGLRAGDIILEVNRTEVGSREALEAALGKARSARIPLLVRRGNKILYLVLARSDLAP